ncbi:ABC transporter [Actinomarinicola tropica]|uniref:ABC transporter n=1 Tax=Actinomarinicola tropica TaxID=2789776 RepID=A0A5Q2RJJ7_9ACTN|nr:ABC transporter [Actinomarinicola tropica]
MRSRLDGASLPLATDGADDARRLAGDVLRQLDDYVVPRLRDIDAPVLAVVGGSTGSGKSTLVNSLVGRQVTTPGVLRPTTRSPVLVHHPDAARWFDDDRVLGSFARVRGGQAAGPQQLELVDAEALPPDLALLDAPDVDSVVDLNRETAVHLLDAADLWIFVTTAARYADAVPWEHLRGAATRGVGIGLVLNRVPSGSSDEVGPHLRTMLDDAGLDGAPLFVVEEQPLVAGRLPEEAVAPLRTWIGSLAGDHAARDELVRRSLVGAIDDLVRRTDHVAAVVDHQVAVAAWLEQGAVESFVDCRRRLSEDVRDGTVMRGEVLARWQDLVGTGELLRQLQSRIGQWRDAVAARLTGRARSVERFQGAVESGIEVLVAERVAAAVERTCLLWRSESGGAALLDAHDDLRRPSEDLGSRTARTVREWQGALLDMLREEGSGKRTTAKVLSYGLNGVALVLMVGVFAQTGGLTGAEVAIAGGSTAVGSTLLEALLGDQAVRRLTLRARADLDRRLDEVIGAEQERYTRTLDASRPDPGDADGLRAAGAELRAQVAT